MANLLYVVAAIGFVVVVSAVWSLKERWPKRPEASIDAFARGLRALAPAEQHAEPSKRGGFSFDRGRARRSARGPSTAGARARGVRGAYGLGPGAREVRGQHPALGREAPDRATARASGPFVQATSERSAASG